MDTITKFTMCHELQLFVLGSVGEEESGWGEKNFLTFGILNVFPIATHYIQYFLHKLLLF
jgi:hypothetical protein